MLVLATIGVSICVWAAGWLLYGAARRLNDSRDWLEHSQSIVSDLQLEMQRLDRIENKLDEILRRLNAATQPAVGQAAPSPAPAAPGVPNAAESYQPGAVAIVRTAPDKPRDLQAIPADSVGGFVYDGGHRAYVGVIAQEVQAVMPQAVERGPDGYLRVYYDKLGLKFQTFDKWIASGARIPTATSVAQ